MSTIVAKVDIRGQTELQAKLKQLDAKAMTIVAAYLRHKGERIMTASKAEVPVDTGRLRSSGHVQGPTLTGRTLEVTMGYGGAAARYALKVHENPRAGRTGGRSPRGRSYKHWAKVGQWKYLEGPFTRETATFLQELAAAISRALAG